MSSGDSKGVRTRGDGRNRGATTERRLGLDDIDCLGADSLRADSVGDGRRRGTRARPRAPSRGSPSPRFPQPGQQTVLDQSRGRPLAGDFNPYFASSFVRDQEARRVSTGGKSSVGDAGRVGGRPPEVAFISVTLQRPLTPPPYHSTHPPHTLMFSLRCSLGASSSLLRVARPAVRSCESRKDELPPCGSPLPIADLRVLARSPVSLDSASPAWSAPTRTSQTLTDTWRSRQGTRTSRVRPRRRRG